jgi:hypothetical protein
MAECEQLALNPRVPPARFSRAIRITSAASASSIGGRPVRWVGPSSANEAARPAQERVRGDQAMATQCAGQPPNESGEHRPVRPVQARAWVGAAQDGDLMAQHKELDVLGGRRAAQQEDKPEHMSEDQVEQPQRHAGIMPNQRSPPVSGPSLTSGTPQVRDRFGIAFALRAQPCEQAAADIEHTDVDRRVGRWDGNVISSCLTSSYTWSAVSVIPRGRRKRHRGYRNSSAGPPRRNKIFP